MAGRRLTAETTTMKNVRFARLWEKWGLVPRLLFAVGVTIMTGGAIQTYLSVAEGAAEHSARLERDMNEAMIFLVPLVADQAVLGKYEAISRLLKTQVKRGEIDRFEWTGSSGKKKIVAQDAADENEAPAWFLAVADIKAPEGNVKIEAGGVGYGTLHAVMTPVKAGNRLWAQFVKQLQIVVVTLFLMLQLIWLIFRRNLGTMHMLAEGANRFSQGDHAVRIKSEGAPEVRLAVDAFNAMASSIENLLNSLGKSESKNRLLATIVEQSSEAIWTRDLAGTITSWNAAAVAMFGYSAAEAVGSKLKVSRLGSEEAEDRRSQRRRGWEKFSYEVKVLTRSAGEVDVQVAVAPLVDDDNQNVGTISIAHDITERNRNEEDLRLARQAAESANHAKGSFLARMSHEIRTPMNGVLGMTELLLETELTGTQRRYAETVRRSGKNLLDIINDILDFSKIEAGKLELEHIDMDLRVTVEDVVELLAERAQSKGLELACNIAPEVTTDVKGDPLRLGQILTNLVGNAIKFTERGGIVISVAPDQEVADQLTLRFEVSDSGTGIAPDAMERIFENFSQADGSTTRRHGGTGLGLPISKQLVEMMGGRLHAESAPGVGSVFWFTCRLEKQATQRPIDILQPEALNGVRVLVVEHSVTNRGLIDSQIASWGMICRTAETPQQALEMLAQAAAQGTPFDVAVLDMGVPGTAALELARTIRTDATHANLRLVMLTAVGRHADIRASREAGIEACLAKPVRQTALYKCLINVLAGASEQAVSSGPARASGEAVPLRVQGNILLAEDNVINQEVALAVLVSEGYRVTVVDNGKKALDAHAQSPFDLILMDCQMPEMDGYEASRQIREIERRSNAKRIPIIALTANAMSQDREECLNAGMDDYLSKPYGRLQMQDMLNRWLPPAVPGQTQAEKLASAAPASVAQVLDPAVLETLRASQAHDRPDALERVINLYLVDSPKLIVRLKQAAAANDFPEIARTAHTLKSSSENLGAMALTRLCQDLEASARLTAVDDAGKLLADIDAAYGSVHAALTAAMQLKAA